MHIASVCHSSGLRILHPWLLSKPGVRGYVCSSFRALYLMPAHVQVAIVTGSDSGIGRAIAYHYACEGANIAIAYWQEDQDGKDTASACEKAGAEVILVPGDLSKYETCQ